MRNFIDASAVFRLTRVLSFIVLLMVSFSCKDETSEAKMESAEKGVESSEVVIWHIKAVHPEGRLIDVKAMDKDNQLHEVKAFQYSDQRSFMDIKTLVGKKRFPVKILVGGDKYTRIKAIADDSTVYDIKAFTPEGDTLDVRGVSRTRNVIHIKAVDQEGTLYGVKAISPEGKLNDVKGVKVTGEQTEMWVNGHAVYAHVKSLPQAGTISNDRNWHVKAIHPEGNFMEVKAVDEDGNTYEVKAIQDNFQRHLLDVKALVEGEEVPIKMLASKDEYAPVTAVTHDGTLLDIKVLTAGGDQLDVKGVRRSGNIVHLKAISKEGDFYGVKAISPDGELNDVKGIKIAKEEIEMTVNGLDIYAHVKALPQID